MSSGNTGHIIINQHYRERTALGTSLMETLDGLIEDNRITPDLALKILDNFDAAIADVLANDVKTTFKARAHLHTYNHVDDVLNMKVSGKLTLREDKWHSKELELKKMRIVAMRAQDAHVASQRAAQ